MIRFLEFFILQRFMNITLDLVMKVHQAGVEFMEEATRVFPERNGARNPNAHRLEYSQLLHNYSQSYGYPTLLLVGKRQYARC